MKVFEQRKELPQESVLKLELNAVFRFGFPGVWKIDYVAFGLWFLSAFVILSIRTPFVCGVLIVTFFLVIIP